MNIYVFWFTAAARKSLINVRTLRWYVNSDERDGEATALPGALTGEDEGVEGPLNEAKRLMPLTGHGGSEFLTNATAFTDHDDPPISEFLTVSWRHRHSVSRFSTHPAFGGLPIEPSYLEPANARVPEGFTFIPNFLDTHEQATLLSFALQKLDDSGSRAYKKRRKLYASSLSLADDVDPDNIFLPENLYEFQKGHYDGVIFNYRECHLTSWPEHLSLGPILKRLYSLLPSYVKIQTHLLHLSSKGHIMPHVDNLHASGSWIVAVSLGGPRILRMEDKENKHNFFELLLAPGSAYIQRDHIRYSYRHSILPGGRDFKGKRILESPRLSIMLRVFTFSLHPEIIQ
ncbi:hypothetical protein Clacol_006510 [Clathrus columnatus]|uniref:Fe2OG dioxygenase domain-containing protein n=1 Tax=Clathrus columnatus TaxID=1419009 RepID=A0AAV5AC98_9AGAM|nr:hypothetical protein Clacol_006510 [Clathrus columnatus]